MFKHILVATDGSDLSERAVAQAIDLAKQYQAKLTALTVVRPWHAVAPPEVMVAFPEPEYRREAEATAAQYLKSAVDAAQKAGVTCETLSVDQEYAWQAIVSTAESLGCDLVVMASHGWRGLTALLLGSETQKVLTHSSIPVLVCR